MGDHPATIEVGLGYGWLLRSLYGAIAVIAAVTGFVFQPTIAVTSRTSPVRLALYGARLCNGAVSLVRLAYRDHPATEVGPYGWLLRRCTGLNAVIAAVTGVFQPMRCATSLYCNADVSLERSALPTHVSHRAEHDTAGRTPSRASIRAGTLQPPLPAWWVWSQQGSVRAGTSHRRCT